MVGEQQENSLMYIIIHDSFDKVSHIWSMKSQGLKHLR